MTEQGSEKDIVVIGVAYPDTKRFLSDYFDSLERQSCSNFHLLIANDGLENLDILLSARELFWQTMRVSGSASDNRRALIHKAMGLGYRKIIFTDCDDIVASNRVEVIGGMLDTAIVVVNDLDIIGVNGKKVKSSYFSQRFSEQEMITANSLCVGNLIGLTNAGARSEVFKKCPALISGDSIAFDWYLWSSILFSGVEAWFTSETSTKYRIYGSNTAGLPQLIDEDSVIKGVRVKCQHYALIGRLDVKYKLWAAEYLRVGRKMKNNAWRREYILALKENEINNNMWWENIRIPSEVGLT